MAPAPGDNAEYERPYMREMPKKGRPAKDGHGNSPSREKTADSSAGDRDGRADEIVAYLERIASSVESIAADNRWSVRLLERICYNTSRQIQSIGPYLEEVVKGGR